MMQLKTSRFGDLEVAEEACVTFASGLVGFPAHRRFIVLDVSEDSEYQWLQSLEDPGLALILVDMHVLQTDFRIEVPDESLRELDLRPDDPLLLLAVVTIPADAPEKASANLRAPVVVNLRTRRGKQLILHESIPLRFPLLPRMGEANAAVSCTPEPASV
jgi:flagellar assembly factor FliW